MPKKPLVHLVVNDNREVVVEALRETAKELKFQGDIQTLRVFENSFFHDICASAPSSANSYLGANVSVNPNSCGMDILNTRYTPVMYMQIDDEQYQRALPIEERARQVAREERIRRENASDFYQVGDADADAE